MGKISKLIMKLLFQHLITYYPDKNSLKLETYVNGTEDVADFKFVSNQ
jgi:hypothetical protein